MQLHTYEILDRVENSHWWHTGRRELIKFFVQEIHKEKPKMRILDVGCGTGANLMMLSQFGEAEGIDISDEAVKFCAQKNLKVKKAPIEKLPFADKSFDLVTALDVIEHLEDDATGLREIYRVLKPGGKTLIFVPAFMWLWGVQDDVSNHKIRYTKKQIVERLEKVGFIVDRATYANITFFLPILIGRFLMRLLKIRPKSENNINIGALNGIFRSIFGFERHILKHFDIPFGVSIIILASKEIID